MDSKSVHPKQSPKIGQDIIDFYKPYVNNKIIWKKTALNNVVFDLPEYYEPKQIIGGGAYGAVAVAIDKRLPENERQSNMIAIKKMTNVFEHKTFTRRIFRELRLLRLLKHQNIVELKTIILPRSREEFVDIYAVFQKMDSDFACVLKKQRQKQKQPGYVCQLNEAHFKFFTYQILKALKFIHTSGVVHRDIKTRNLLLNQDCTLKICDFGLARALVTEQSGAVMTDYVATRWYRAPELLLGETKYTPAIDIWSVGCILAQMILRKPFLQANSTSEQLQLICEVVDPPNLAKIKQKNPKHFQVLAKILSKKHKKSMIDSKIKGLVSDDCVNLLKKMLSIDPNQRITTQQALQHNFVKDYRQINSQIQSDPIDPLQLQFDNYNLTTEQLKDLIYQEILLYHFSDFTKKYQQKLKNNVSVISHILNNSNAKVFNPWTDGDDEFQLDQ